MHQTKRRDGLGGFTLIELMIVVAIIGILAAIAIPRFADLIRKSKEGAVKGTLGAFRSALVVYYGDQEGVYPFTANQTGTLQLTGLTPTYIASIPQVAVPYTTGTHDSTGTVTGYAGGFSGSETVAWGVGTSTGAFIGTVWVNCTHALTGGSIWTAN